MPPRPFPLPHHIGTDITHIPRFTKFLINQVIEAVATKPPPGTKKIDQRPSPHFRYFDPKDSNRSRKTASNTVEKPPAATIVNTSGQSSQSSSNESTKKISDVILAHVGHDVPLDRLPEREVKALPFVRGLMRLLHRMMTPREQRLFWEKYETLERIAEDEERLMGASRFLAGRWAAKEAIVKAYAPSRRLFLTDIEVHAFPGSGPFGILLDHPCPLDVALEIESQDAPSDPVSATLKASELQSSPEQLSDPEMPAAAEQAPTEQPATKHDNDNDAHRSSSSRPDKHIPHLRVLPAMRIYAAHLKQLSRANSGLSISDALTLRTTPTKPASASATDAAQVEESNYSVVTRMRTSLKKTLEKVEGQAVRVSISHDGEYATAVAVAAPEPVGDVGGEAAAREWWR